MNSKPSLALAVCSGGIVGSFPAHGTRSRKVLESWLTEMREGIGDLKIQQDKQFTAPYAVNLVVQATYDRMLGDLESVVKLKVTIVIAAKSTPVDVVNRIQPYGGLVMSEIATPWYAEKAGQEGVDAIIAFCDGAGVLHILEHVYLILANVTRPRLICKWQLSHVRRTFFVNQQSIERLLFS